MSNRSTDSARDFARSLANPDMSVGQIKAAMAAFQNDVERTEKALAASSKEQFGGGDNLPTVTTRSQFDALQSGDQYINKNGDIVRKP
jgi:hypothetical protein